MDIKDNKLVLKAVKDLSKCNFFIPSYQRGYRWTELQVKQLLDDIWDFASKKNRTQDGKEGQSESNEFYCLQPLIINSTSKREPGHLEVIDGQQRLTTIILIIHYINKELPEINKLRVSEPGIQYQTREKSAQFISGLKFKDKNESNLVEENNLNENDNIDFFHIALAYKTIHEWFRSKGLESDLSKFEKAFFLSTKVIWYEVHNTNEHESIKLFTRINAGKIPLTNAELIKALFLKKSNFIKNEVTLKQILIASEWDNIERTLQSDDFWYFIYKPNSNKNYDTRIEYIFDIMEKNLNKHNNDYYFTFLQFNSKLNSLSDEKKYRIAIEKIWYEIKCLFLMFESWYQDSELFHYIGFLIDSGASILDIKEHFNVMSKSEFKNYLKNEIKKQIRPIKNIEELSYTDGTDKIKIKKILLLFNIQTILSSQKSEMRFPFDRYKNESWDIEHVCSQTEKKISSTKEQREWAKEMRNYFDTVPKNDTTKELNNELAKLEDLLNEGNKSDDFDRVFQYFQNYFGEEKIESIDSISNLTLLNSSINRSYGNAFFPIKRQCIIENDKSGIFIPIATKNLFLKYYSKNNNNMSTWSENDAKDYLNELKTMLSFYLKEDNKDNNV